MTAESAESSHRSTARRVVVTSIVVVALLAAVWFQRATISAAFGEIRRLSAIAVVILIVLTVFERWSRADIVRRLLGHPVDTGRALTIHDVGTAVSKGVPLGGALGTALRWSICRDSGVRPTRFATMLIAFGIATTFASWLLPLGAVLLDLTQRAPDTTDLVLVGLLSAVLIGAALFWAVVLSSDRLESWATGITRRVWSRLSRRLSSLDGIEPAAGVAEVRTELRSIARRPWGVLGRTLLAQACGASILLVALRALGAGAELGTTEFLRVFFVVHLAGTFAPTPGGVGVVEAGMTGALIAAGVDAPTALAGVLIYRFATYVVPIGVGAVLYLVWRVRTPDVASAILSGHGTPLDTDLPDLSRTANQGIRDDGHARRDDRARARARRGPPVGVHVGWSRPVP